jgi:hypothetical protein
MDFVFSPPGCGQSVTTEDGMPMRRSYIVLMRWMVMYECEVPGGALNLSSTKLPRPWFPSRKNTHCRTRNRTDVRGWDAHEVQLRCPDEVDGDV